MAKEAWGRWGADDEIGAVNLIDQAKVRAATALVKEGRVLSLAQPLSGRTPVPRQRATLQHFMGRDGGDYAPGVHRPGGFQFAEDSLVLSTHAGTHIDALCHVWTDDALYNGFDSRSIRSGSGAARCGMDKLPPIVARGVLIDIVALKGRTLELGEVITRDDVERALDATGTAIMSGDVALLRTGWQERFGSDPNVDFDSEPGLDVAAAEYLAEAGVALVGADNFAIEVMPFPNGTVFPVHQRLIRDYGTSLIEGLVLKELASTGRSVFCFVAAPLPIVGGTGSPLTPLAVL